MMVTTREVLDGLKNPGSYMLGEHERTLLKDINGKNLIDDHIPHVILDSLMDAGHIYFYYISACPGKRIYRLIKTRPQASRA